MTEVIHFSIISFSLWPVMTILTSGNLFFFCSLLTILGFCASINAIEDKTMVIKIAITVYLTDPDRINGIHLIALLMIFL